MEDAVINRFVFTLLSTSWVWVVYGIEQRWSFVFGNVLLTSFALISVPFLLTIVWIVLAKCFSHDNIVSCADIDEANNDFLANYLGYVFIGIGVDDLQILIFVYLIIFVLTFAVQSKCFNPVLLILGFKYYDVTTSEGTRVFVISKRNLRKPDEVEFNNLRSINNMSYIELGR